MAEHGHLESVKPTRYTWNSVGDELEGVIISRSWVDMREGPAALKYTLKQVAGNLVSFLAGVQIVEALQPMPLGTYIKIIYLGRPAGQRYKDYDILAEPFQAVDYQIDTGTGEIEPHQFLS